MTSSQIPILQVGAKAAHSRQGQSATRPCRPEALPIEHLAS
jgi:hypothetical protein